MRCDAEEPMKPRIPWCLSLSFALLAALGCSGGSTARSYSGSGGTPPPSGGLTIAEVYDRTIASLRAGTPDSDGDGIPDDIEQDPLHTNPLNVDSDGDGVFDNVEIFGDKTWSATDLLLDKNHNGIIAALDQDDDSDGKNDGELVDSDLDGIPNYLEFYGFTYDALTGTPKLWDGDHAVSYYKTDPNQRSTDQDPFDDRTEVSGTNMDVSVKGPGDLPMVPALPEIVVRLEGYQVALNSDITVTNGRTIGKEATWDATATATDSRTREDNWEVGVEAEVGFSFPGISASVKAHANYGGSIANTHETSNALSRGGSLVNTEEWSQATTTNPTTAAKIKLFLKVYNQGSACASNVIPTLTLRVGGHSVATFKPGENQINLLEPGGTYPSTPGVYWVVDSNQAGKDIFLTLNELRALESGAPVSITMTQMVADVMRLNPNTGAYERMGDWSEYQARCRAVCADLYFDLGDGNFVHSLVYADGRPTAPRVTLGDAFLWGVGGSLHQGLGFTYRDMAGLRQEIKLDDWSICLDGATYEANGLVKGGPFPPGFNLFDLRLNPSSVIVAKAPRILPPDILKPEPDIFYAYFDRASASVNAVVGDYHGVAKVEFIEKVVEEGKAPLLHLMSQDLPGSDFYVFRVADSSYEFDGTEKVRVTNIKGDTAEQTLTGIYTTPKPIAPAIESARVKWAQSSTSASGAFFLESRVVAPGADLAVLLFPDSRYLNSPLEEHKPIPLSPVTDAFGEGRTQMYSCSLESLVTGGPTVDLTKFTNMLLVAYYKTAPSLVGTKEGSTFEANFPFNVGQVNLYSYYGWYWDDDWYQDSLDLDNGAIQRFAWEEGDGIPYPNENFDAWFWWQAGIWMMDMRGNHYTKHSGTETYDEITSDIAKAAVLDRVGGYPTEARAGDTFILQTNRGRRAKMQVVEFAPYDPSGAYNRALRVLVRFTVFN